MKIKVILLARLPGEWWGQEQVKEYMRRISGRWKTTLIHSENAKPSEGNFTVILDENGIQLSSEKFAELLYRWENEKKEITFVIGGPYGVKEEWKKKGNYFLSLSRMTLPHQMALLFLLEQTYRAHTILSGHPYHH